MNAGLNITSLLSLPPHTIVIGNQPHIVQSVLDFDFLCGNPPSVKAIIGTTKRYERFFYGDTEIIIPAYKDLRLVPAELSAEITYVINLSSGRRALDSCLSALKHLPQLKIIAIFAESVPEQHALVLRKESTKHSTVIIGPATVGFLVPGIVKLGAIGGTDYKQINDSQLNQRGSIAIMSSSGGMTNELINIVAQSGYGVSFAISFGGERFPVLQPRDAFLAAEMDPQTKAIAYFGELGGDDEYELVELIKKRKVTKPIIAYIAGRVAELFEEPPQFGHAKAIARTANETASAKQDALVKAGAIVPKTFGKFVAAINGLTGIESLPKKESPAIGERQSALFVSSIAKTNHNKELTLVGKTLHELARQDYGHIVASLLLGHPPTSRHTEHLTSLILKLLADHGPNVAGALNTIITASAGKDLVTSVSSGLLTIGPRFGGAVNGAADTLLYGMEHQLTAPELVEQFARERRLIPGIGHKKYRVDVPDPRVNLVIDSLPRGMKQTFIIYAHEIEKITTKKSGSLILNVDGIIAAALLDTLYEHEAYSHIKLRELVEIEFFNAFFVAARSIGFIGHYLDQRRLDQGLFRLDDKFISSVSIGGD